MNKKFAAAILLWMLLKPALADLQFDYVFGSTGSANDQFNVVAAIEFDAQNRMYVLDRGNDRIQVFNPDLSFHRSIMLVGSAFDFTIDDTGNVYTTDSLKVRKYDPSGAFIGWSGQCVDGANCNSTIGDGDDSNNYSTGFICTDQTCQLDTLVRPDQTTVRVGGLINYADGFLYSQNASFIFRSDLDNTWIDTSTVPDWGGNHSDFEVLANGDLLVLDPFNDRAVRIDPSGNLLFEIRGRFGGELLNIPFGIDVDPDGNIFIVDVGNHSVVKFDSVGTYLDRSPFSAARPFALEVDLFGNVYYVSRDSTLDANDDQLFRLENPGNVVVNSVADVADDDLNDGECDTGNRVGNLPECTLRAAIEESNAQAGRQSILFAIPQNQASNGVFVINVFQLPVVSDPVSIEGITQPGFQFGSPVVEVVGVGMAAADTGFRITAGSTVIRGLSIYGFSRNGIKMTVAGNNRIESNIVGTNALNIAMPGNGEDGIVMEDVDNNIVGGGAASLRNVVSRNGLSGTGGCGILVLRGADNVISGNYVGTTTDGRAPAPNAGTGVCLVDAPFNRVGGVSPAERNVISANVLRGVLITEPQAGNNLVLGNLVGLNVAGDSALGNGREGVMITQAGVGNQVGDGSLPGRNVISGNGRDGVFIIAGNGFNNIDGNLIGLNEAGTAALPNMKNGVFISESPHNRVGVTGPNVISGNAEHGILVSEDPSHGNQIQDNLIGTGPSGLQPFPNTLDGVRLAGARDTHLVGNVISGNGGNGVSVFGATPSGEVNPNQASAGNLLAFNWIGASLNGGPQGNGIDGVSVRNSSENIIGPDNLIRSNGSAGVTVAMQSHGLGNTITLNSIHDNIALGIDLDDDFITANDSLDLDDGANARQNFPIITHVRSAPLNAFEASLNSRPGSSFVVEAFSNGAADAGGNGEGEVIENAVTVTTDPSGDVSFVAGFTFGQTGDCIALTARDETTGDTSEFSPCVPIPPPPPVTFGVDFGDAPSSYPTLGIDNGARHLIIPNIVLGSGVDREPNGQPSADATGDDLDGSADEGGVVFPGRIFTFADRTLVEVSASATGFIDAWIDFDADGSWSEGDRIFDSEPVVPGINVLEFSVPSDATPGPTFGRFRFSTAGGLSPAGPAFDGEVEDYRLVLQGAVIYDNGFE